MTGRASVGNLGSLIGYSSHLSQLGAIGHWDPIPGPACRFDSGSTAEGLRRVARSRSSVEGDQPLPPGDLRPAAFRASEKEEGFGVDSNTYIMRSGKLPGTAMTTDFPLRICIRLRLDA